MLTLLLYSSLRICYRLLFERRYLVSGTIVLMEYVHMHFEKYLFLTHIWDHHIQKVHHEIQMNSAGVGFQEARDAK